jgi:hypothetical protein
MGRQLAPPRVEASPGVAFHRRAPAAAPPPPAEASQAAPRVPELDDLFTGGG